jgi:putative transcriptional regulator
MSEPAPAPAAGHLLVATPVIAEPTFGRTVVLLLQAGGDEGALGVVLNRPSPTEVASVLPGWERLVAGPPVVFEGGPVQQSAAVCLARLQPGVEDGEGLAPLPVPGPGPRFATVDLDAEPGVVAPSVARLRVFAGYAGWSAGQLEGEIAEGAWWVLDALPDDAFPDRPDLLWRQVLRRQGPPLAFAVTLPEDPALN